MLLLASCASHTRQECASFDVHLEDEQRDAVSMLLVIDPHIPSGRTETLTNGLMWGVRTLMTGDRDGDGAIDFAHVDVLRVAVITTDGTLIQTAPSPAPPRPRSIAPDEDGMLMIWPQTSHAWDAWFEAALYQRVHDALGMPVGPNTPMHAVEAFVRAHPMFSTEAVVVIATDRDDESHSDPMLQTQTLRSLLRGPATFALIGAVPDQYNVEIGDFRPVLGPQPFDEAHALCDDSTDVGHYPRALLGHLGALRARGFDSILESLCNEPRDFVSIVRSLVGRDFGCCLPSAPAIDAQGRVDCEVTVRMPVFGGHHCAEFGLALINAEDDGDGFLRERCVLPQIAHPPGVAPTTEFAFFYDDFTAGLYGACPATPQRIAEARPLPNGVRFDVHCNTSCPGDAGVDAALVDAR
jgi:hypothetical protein